MNQRTVRVFSLHDLGTFRSAELDSVSLVAHAVLGSLGSTLACGEEGNRDVEQAGDKLEMELHLESGACEGGEISLGRKTVVQEWCEFPASIKRRAS